MKIRGADQPIDGLRDVDRAAAPSDRASSVQAAANHFPPRRGTLLSSQEPVSLSALAQLRNSAHQRAPRRRGLVIPGLRSPKLERASPRQLRKALLLFLREGGTDRVRQAFGAEGASTDHLIALAQAPSFFEKNANQPLVAPAPRGPTSDWTMSSNHLFRASYFVRNSHHLAALKAQPWLRWDPRTQQYELKTTGADEAILRSLGKVRLYRGTHRLEAELLLGAKALLEGSNTGQIPFRRALEEALQTWTLTGEERSHLERLATNLPSIWSGSKRLRRAEAGRLLLAFEPDRSGYIATTPRRDIAEVFAFHRGEMEAELGRVLSFEVDLGALPAELLGGIYGGIEALDIGSSPEDLHQESFHEVSFRSLEAKLAMLEGLSVQVETESDYTPTLTAPATT